MPSPVGHSLAGYFIGQINQPHSKGWFFLMCLFAANAADLDFLPGLLVGEPNRFHHGFSHSIGFGVVFALGFAPFLRSVLQKPFLLRFVVVFALYVSHVLLDFVTLDTAKPYGVPLLWPLSPQYFIAPFAFLLDIHRTSTSNSAFFLSLFSLHNFVAIGVEIALFAPLLLLAHFIKRVQNHCTSTATEN